MAESVEITNLEIEVTAETKDIDAKLNKVIATLERVAGAFEGVKPAAKDAGDESEKAGDKAAKGAKGFGKFGQSILRIAKYRVIRSVLRAITNAFKEGLGNAYQYSKLTGGEFANAMDRAATSIQYFKNALGAALVPAITALMPLFEALIDYVAELGNGIAVFFARITGQKSVMVATKNWKEYAKAANEAKNAVLGFDELNIISGGNVMGEDYADMFEYLDLSTEKAGELEDQALSAAVAIGGLAGAASLINVHPLAAAFVALVSALSALALSSKGVVGGFKSLKETADNAFSGFIDKIAEKNPDLKNFLEIVKGLATFLGDIVELNLNGIVKLFGHLGDAVAKLFRGDWEGAGKSVLDMLVDLINAFVDANNAVVRLHNTLDNTFNGGQNQYGYAKHLDYDWKFVEDKVAAAAELAEATSKVRIGEEVSPAAYRGVYGTMPWAEDATMEHRAKDQFDWANYNAAMTQGAIPTYTTPTGSDAININLTVELDGRQIASSIENVEYTNGAKITSHHG